MARFEEPILTPADIEHMVNEIASQAVSAGGRPLAM